MEQTSSSNINKSVELLRECSAMLIPSGAKVNLAKGVKVTITYKLGGNFTVNGPFGMARIDGSEADALGEESPKSVSQKLDEELLKNAIGNDSNTFPMPTADDLWAVAKTVFDPEIPVNLVDLGLIYKLEITEDLEGKRIVDVDMTLTAPGCSFAPMIADDLRLRLEGVPGVDKATVNIVWDPPWNKDMITEEGKMILGLI